MKKLALVLLAASVVPAVAFANDPAPAAKKEAPAMAAAAPAAGAPLTLKDGKTSVKVLEGKVMVSTDGKAWAPAPDGTHELSNGTKITTKGGLEIK